MFSTSKLIVENYVKVCVGEHLNSKELVDSKELLKNITTCADLLVEEKLKKILDVMIEHYLESIKKLNYSENALRDQVNNKENIILTSLVQQSQAIMWEREAIAILEGVEAFLLQRLHSNKACHKYCPINAVNLDNAKTKLELSLRKIFKFEENWMIIIRSYWDWLDLKEEKPRLEYNNVISKKKDNQILETAIKDTNIENIKIQQVTSKYIEATTTAIHKSNYKTGNRNNEVNGNSTGYTTQNFHPICIINKFEENLLKDKAKDININKTLPNPLLEECKQAKQNAASAAENYDLQSVLIENRPHIANPEFEHQSLPEAPKIKDTPYYFNKHPRRLINNSFTFPTSPMEFKDDEYRLPLGTKGNILVINIIHYEQESGEMSWGLGAKADSWNICTTFHALGFTYECHDDPDFTYTGPYITEVLEKFRKKCLDENVSSFVVYFCGQGNDDQVKASNGDLLRFEDILCMFNAEICKKLVKIPKIFVFDCCRVFTQPSSVRSLETPSKLSLPIENAIVCLATEPGQQAWRYSIPYGSAFTHCFTYVLRTKAHNTDLFKILKEAADRTLQISQQKPMYKVSGTFKTLYFNMDPA